MASSSTRRIFPIDDWAPAHEALFPDADSTIDAPSSFAIPTEASSSTVVPNPSHKLRSMSFPWRPKSTAFNFDDVENKFRDFSLERSHTSAHIGQDSGEAAVGKGKGKKKAIGGILRRASVSLKGLVHRRSSLVATDTFQEPRDEQDKHETGRRFLRRASHAHAQFQQPTSPLSSSAACGGQQQQARPTTGHAINATWHRLRQAASFRHSRVLYGDFVLQEDPSPPHDNLAEPSTRPGVGNEPPIIPRNSGLRAKAAVAAWQNEMFPTAHGHALLNKRLTGLGEVDGQSDRESGIGIAVTSPQDSDLDLVTAEGEQILNDGPDPAPGISRVDFIDRLPVELAIQVLAHLDAAGLTTASVVSRRWNKMAATQHIWRESFLREKTGTYATSGLIKPGSGLGVPAVKPNVDWNETYRVTEELGRRWKEGKATPIYLNGHSDSIYCLQFDEEKIITGSRDKTIRVWDMHTKACKLVIGPPEVVKDSSLLYDEEGTPIHSATSESLQAIDTSTMTTASTHASSVTKVTTRSVPTTVSFQTHHKASILCLQYDDRILVTGSSDASCIVHDVKGGYRPIRRLRHHNAAVLDLCFDDKHIVTCSKDISICVWDRNTGALLRQLRGHSGPVNAVQMRGNTIVSCSGDFRVKLWNIDTGKNIREFQGHTKGLACSQFSEDGRYVASAGNDKVIRIWDANTGECLREMKAHESLVRSLHIDSVSGRLVSGSYDTDIKVFDMETGVQLLDFPKWHASWVLSAKSDYRRIVSTGQDPKILVMDFGQGVRGIEKLESCATREKLALDGTNSSEVDAGYI